MAHVLGAFFHHTLEDDVQRLRCYIVGFKMVSGKLCLRESLPFHSANPKRGPSLLRCSTPPFSARRQKALRSDRFITPDWSRVRTRQRRRPRSARYMLTGNQPADVRISNHAELQRPVSQLWHAFCRIVLNASSPTTPGEPAEKAGDLRDACSCWCENRQAQVPEAVHLIQGIWLL